MRFNQSISRGAAAALTKPGTSVGNELQIEKASISASEYVEPTNHWEFDSVSSKRRTASAILRFGPRSTHSG